MGKRCTSYNHKYPSWMFKTDIRKYTIPEAQKKVRCCRICVFKQSRNEVVRYNSSKFERKKLTFKQRLKELQLKYK